ncbi:Gfo/Idh/MocA family protein [Aquibacillus albus]|uniref:Dehydrogenase n=1 Tax=Aquibacillus albus TaxID=1168171 RepID=A0ABS2MWN8_9BACI|nr:Gfo/Idh/MocA family oxidoreductase [Aquibacillus albus]MBM7570269.1 putative dehydrogenase [Aquibacillus albus]
MRKVKWGVLSTANIGLEQVIPAIERSNNCEVVAIASRGEKAKQTAEELGITTAYTSYEGLLQDPEIEAVYIPLPNSMHKEWVIKAAEHGKHILCEKPAALNLSELEEMLAACEQHGVTFMEAFMYQFHPQHEKVKALIQDGEIGEVASMRASFSFVLNDGENIRLIPELGGGSMYDVGCYTIHVIRNILDEEPVNVYASSKIHPQFNVETNTAGVLTFANGVQATFDSSFEAMSRQTYQVVGSKGKIDVNGAFRPDTLEGGAGIIQLTKENGEVEEFAVEGDQYKLQVEHFAQCVIENKQPSYSKEKIRNQMKVFDASLQSMNNGSNVALK